jgi:hypothetical protein
MDQQRNLQLLRTTVLCLSLLVGLYEIGHGRKTEENIDFPSDLFISDRKPPMKNGILDVKRLFGAVGDGVHDDTQALIDAMNYVMQSSGPTNKNANHGNSTNIIYLPNGTYLVSRTVIHSTYEKQRLYSIRFQGQNRDRTVIKLKDNAFGESNLPVVSFGNETSNNLVASNFFENITIDTGTGNPGAIGLRFAGANNAAVRKVTIKSTDPKRKGLIGIDISIGSTHGYYHDIEIVGFDYGFKFLPVHQTHVSLEDIRLIQQARAGLWLIDSGVSARKIHSVNSVPAVLMTGDAGHLVIIDSNLRGSDEKQAAIDSQKGVLFVRNVHTHGYGLSIKRELTSVTARHIKEYVSHTVSNIFPNKKRSLNLPIEETPDISCHAFPHKDWVNVTSFGAKPGDDKDDTNEIQQAMNSGKPVIYFPPGKYVLSDSISIPSSVRSVNFMFSDFEPKYSLKSDENKGAFLINGNSSDPPLLLEDLRIWMYPEIKHYWFLHNSKRTLVMKDMHAQRGSMYRNTVSGGKVYLENVSNVDSMVMRMQDPDSVPGNCFTFIGQKVWARWFNPERAEPQMLNEGSTIWILGFKTEYEGPQFIIRKRGKTELLGGCVNVSAGKVSDDIQVLINEASDVSAIFHTTNVNPSEEGKYFTNVILEKRNGMSKYLRWEPLPKRKGNQIFMPLYAGYK